ncbi:MAG: GAF domain-containing protein [Planctomycetota bacterium]|nr:MAG: GAF domain-containing protein [Planctomycetota bacterium]
MPTDVGDLNLSSIADVLVGVESTELLVHRIEQLLTRFHALPARLWLIDMSDMVFYAVAAFACESQAEDLPAQDILMDPPAGHWVLYHQGDPVGLLTTVAEDYQASAVELTTTLLGPSLMAVNNHEQTLRELRQMHLQNDRLITAGRLLQHLDVEVLLTEIMQCILDTVHADVGAILVVNEHGQLEVSVAWGMHDEHIDAITTHSGERLVDVVLDTGQNLRVHGKRLEKELRCTLEGVHLTGVLALPLVSSERKHGVVFLANPQKTFTKDHERLVTVVCDMATIALDNLLLVRNKMANERMQRDMEVAKQVQARMLPEKVPSVEAYVIAGLSQPSEETGGDYYTWLERDGHVVCMIGDVTGHGLGAALFTTAAHAMTQYQLRNSRDLAHAMEALNQGLYHMRSGRFMTAAAVELNPQDLTFTYASAGHNPLLWLHGDEMRWLESSGTPLGIMRRANVTAEEPLQMAVGDVLLLYTDGITEAFNHDGEWWGEEAMATSLRRAHNRGLQGDALIAALMQDLRAFTGNRPLGDDVTLVAITVR